MRRASWTLALTMALGLGSSALADDRHDGIRIGEPYPGQYEGRHHDDDDLYVRHFDEVQSWAHRLSDDAEALHRLAERQAHHFDRREARAFRVLHELSEVAGRFHARTEGWSRSPRQTEREFRRLIRAYVAAANVMDDLHGYRNLYRAFDRVQRDMDRLVRYYGGYGRHGYSYEGRGYRYRLSDGPWSRFRR